MAEPIPSLFVTEKNKLHSTTGWLNLLEIVIDASTSVRVVDDSSNFTWNGKTYYAASFAIGENRSSVDGSLDTIQIVASNISRELMEDVEALRIIDAKAWMRLVHRTSSSATDVLEFRMFVQEIRCTFDSIGLTMGQSDLLSKPFPLNRFSRDRCRWVYKDANCGYVGTMLTCDLSLNGVDGCVAHGADEVANGLTKLHPNRFGGFPAIPQAHN